MDFVRIFFKVLTLTSFPLFVLSCKTGGDVLKKDITAQKMFIINLKSATDRRASMEANLKRIGIPSSQYEFIDAVNGKTEYAPPCIPPKSKCFGPPNDFSPEESSQYSGTAIQPWSTTVNGWKFKEPTYSQLLRSGQLAHDAIIGPIHFSLIQSNKNVWKKILEEKLDWAIVVEDDVNFQPAHWEDLFHIGLFDEKSEFIGLDARILCLENSNGYPIVDGGSLAGYAISKEGAKKALQVFSNSYLPADWQLFMFFRYYTGANIKRFESHYLEYRKNNELINGFCKRPEPIYLNELSKKSTIN